MAEKLTFTEKFSAVQNELKAPKDLYNNFGKYKYRSAESILEAVKPLLQKYSLILTLSDELEHVGERYYVKATATIMDIDGKADLSNTAWAREDLEKKGMDGSQITGTASSYARKCALNGLFLIDDTKDADTDEYHVQTTSKPKKVSSEPLEELFSKEGLSLDFVLNLYKAKSIDELKGAKEQNIREHIEDIKAIQTNTKKGI